MLSKFGNKSIQKSLILSNKANDARGLMKYSLIKKGKLFYNTTQSKVEKMILTLCSNLSLFISKSPALFKKIYRNNLKKSSHFLSAILHACALIQTSIQLRESCHAIPETCRGPSI